MRAALFAALLLLPGLARAQPAAQDAPKPADGDVVLRDVHLHDGGVLPELRLHATTLGTPRRDAAGNVVNAVLLLHGTTGTGRNFLAPGMASHLFGPGQLLDARRDYVIMPDGIGAGGSTKPSDGLRGGFPRYGYLDQVEVEWQALRQMGVGHLRLVLGTSMGGMQAWLWAERHPDAMDAAVAIASLPAPVAGRNMLWRDMIMQAIRTDPDWQGGRYDPAHPPTAWRRVAGPLFTLMTGNPRVLQQDAPTRAAAEQLDQTVAQRLRDTDAGDYLATFDSSFDYDPSADLGRITAPFLSVNFADDLLNPIELDVLPRAMAAVPRGRAVLLPGGYGHQTLTHPEIWAPAVAAFLRSSSG